ncbi:hypothetical protein BDY24DRAFT_416943 [Mrakia frigida]|uniref:uncharacterized protein n=1 Tax=Mrakia frigida TaxID=29902 RepID=UPI003FCC25AD
MDAFTAIFTPFVASAAETTTAPSVEAKQNVGNNAFYGCIKTDSVPELLASP